MLPVISLTGSKSKTDVTGSGSKTNVAPDKITSSKSKTDIVPDNIINAQSSTDAVPEKVVSEDSRPDIVIFVPDKHEPRKALSVEDDELKLSTSSTENLRPLNDDTTGHSVHPIKRKKKKKDKPRVNTSEDSSQTYRDLRDGGDDMVKPEELQINNKHMIRKTIYVPIMDELNMPIWDARDDAAAEQDEEDEDEIKPQVTDGGFGGDTSLRGYRNYEFDQPNSPWDANDYNDYRDSSPVNLRRTTEEADMGPDPTDEEYWSRRSKTPRPHDRVKDSEQRDSERRRNNSSLRREDERRKYSQCPSGSPFDEYNSGRYRRPSITREMIEEARRLLASPRDRSMGQTCNLSFSEDRRKDNREDEQPDDPQDNGKVKIDERLLRSGTSRARRGQRDSLNRDATFGEAEAIRGSGPESTVDGSRERRREEYREGSRERSRERRHKENRSPRGTGEETREERPSDEVRPKALSRHIPHKPGHRPKKKEQDFRDQDPNDDKNGPSRADEQRYSDDITTKTADGHHKVFVGRNKKVHHTHREYEQKINFGEKPPDLEHFRTSKEPAIRRKKNKHARRDHRDTQTSGITLKFESNHDMIKYENKYESRPKYKEGKEPQLGDLDYVDSADRIKAGEGMDRHGRQLLTPSAGSQESVQTIPSYDQLDLAGESPTKPDPRLILSPPRPESTPKSIDKLFSHRDSSGNYIQKPKEKRADEEPRKMPDRSSAKEKGKNELKPPTEEPKKERAEKTRKENSRPTEKRKVEPVALNRPCRSPQSAPCYPPPGCAAAFSLLDLPPTGSQIARQSNDPRLEVYQPTASYTAVELRLLITRIIKRMENRHRLKSRLRTELGIVRQEQERQVALTDELVNRYNSLTNTYENLKKRKCELECAFSPKRFEEMRCQFQAFKQRLCAEVEKRDSAMDTLMRTTDQTLCLFEKTAQNVEDQWLQELTYLRGENAVLDAEYYRTQAAIRQLETDTKKAAEKTKRTLNKLPPPCPVPVCLPLNTCPTSARVLSEARRDRALYYDQVLSLRQQFERAVGARNAKTEQHFQQFEQQLVGISKGLQHVLKTLASVTCDMTPVLTHPVVGCFVASARSMKMDVVEETVTRARQENQRLLEATRNCRKESDDQNELSFAIPEAGQVEYALLPKYRRVVGEEKGHGEGCRVQYH
ncbi:hypothetical protein RvY_00968 [Ramazzottius varieornatus]|uniref:Uncharacterized protein n=1 Tax=Ramazzottius varieornatus TaxID=947166 RepID=A0A1D1UQ04_RAMVA|nr:hypothetical protein RvY_00968 [Ramazzottius varieornatus]